MEESKKYSSELVSESIYSDMTGEIVETVSGK